MAKRKLKFKELINLYVEDHAGTAESTREAYRIILTKNIDLHNLKPQVVWATLNERYAPSTALANIARFSSFYDFLIEKNVMPQPNVFRIWCKKNIKHKHRVFKPKIPNMTFEAAQEKILTIENKTYRTKALQLLYSGMRFSESLKYDPETKTVIGKFGKERKINIPKELEITNFYGTQYKALLRALKKIGLNVHDLRKIYASRLARIKGILAPDLCEDLGWSNFDTARHYINHKTSNEMAAIKKDSFPTIPASAFEGRDLNAPKKQGDYSK